MRTIFSGVLFFLSSLCIHGQFAEPEILRNDYEFESYFTADLDNNGEFDIISANQIHLNPQSESSQYYPLPGNISGDPGDYNQDGWIDLILGSSIYFGDGDMDFTQVPVYIGSGSGVWHATDFDSDGDLDFHNNYFVFQNAGNWIFYEVSIEQCIFPSFFDLDNDDLLDLVYNKYYGVMSNIRWRKNIGDGVFGDVISIASTDSEHSERGWTFTDFDTDGDLDLFLPDYSTALIFENIGDGIFDPDGDMIFQNTQEIRSVQVSDYDGDGDEDVFVSDHYHDIWYSRNNQPVDFTVPALINESTLQFIVDDLDEDDYPDLLISHDNILCRYYPGDNSFDFSQNIPLQGTLHTTYLNVGDMNADGVSDLLFGGAPLCGYILQPTSFFQGAEHLIAGSIQEAKTIWNDFNQDGAMDFVQATTVFINDGDNNFNSTEYPVSIVFNNYFLADLNSDGYDDLVYAYSPSATALLNDGFGGFNVEIPINNQISMRGSADVDGDGDEDLFGNSGILINEGGLTFDLDVSGTMAPGNHLVCGDFMSDGFSDLIYIDQQVYLLPYLGNGDFGEIEMIFPYPATALLVIDYDLDGDDDLLIKGSSEIYIKENYDGQLISAGDINNTEEFNAWTAADFDLDGDQDLLLATQFDNYPDVSTVLLYKNETISGFQINGSVFYDVNESGVLDPGENGLNVASLNISPGGSTFYSGYSGQYFFSPMSPGIYTVSIESLENWQFTSPASLDVELTIDQPISTGQNFGLIPGIEVTDISLSMNPSVPLCNEEQLIVINLLNSGTTIPDATVVLTLDPNITFISAVPSPIEVDGQVITWNIQDINFFSQEMIVAHVIYPSADLINANLTSTTTVNVIDGIDNPILEDELHEILVCSYDPNFKEELTGLTENGYLNGTDPLEYIIHFQNTGNYPATDVVVTDELDPLFDPSTFELIAWSHDVYTSIDDEGKITFSFPGIMLPDSLSDPLGSQGFVRYHIKPAGTVQHLDIIQNNAKIYFDQNFPIITDYTTNTVFDCNEFEATITLSSETDCFVQTSQAFAPDTWIENLGWTVADQEVSNESTLELQQLGSYWLGLEIENGLCGTRSDSLWITVNELLQPEIIAEQTEFCEGTNNTLSSNFDSGNTWLYGGEIISTENEIEIENGGIYELVVNDNGCLSDTISVEITLLDAPGTPVILYEDGVLIASVSGDINFQWYLNGVVIEGADNDTLQISQSGNYTVEVTNDNGCSVLSDNTVVIISVSEIGIDGLVFYPNPVNDQLQIDRGDLSATSNFSMYNVQGQLLFTGNLVNQITVIATGKLSAGIYLVRVVDHDITYYHRIEKL